MLSCAHVRQRHRACHPASLATHAHRILARCRIGVAGVRGYADATASRHGARAWEGRWRSIAGQPALGGGRLPPPAGQESGFKVRSSVQNADRHAGIGRSWRPAQGWPRARSEPVGLAMWSGGGRNDQAPTSLFVARGGGCPAVGGAGASWRPRAATSPRGGLRCSTRHLCWFSSTSMRQRAESSTCGYIWTRRFAARCAPGHVVRGQLHRGDAPRLTDPRGCEPTETQVSNPFGTPGGQGGKGNARWGNSGPSAP